MSNRFARTRDLATAGAASLLTALAVSGGGIAAPLAAPVNTKAPSISGWRNVGNTLTAQPGTWSGTRPIRFAYHWSRCTPQLADCTNIASGRRYTLRAADQGKRLVMVVTASNRDGGRDATADSGVIGARAVAPQNTSTPTIAGTLRAGQVVTANPGGWNGTSPSFRYEWQRCDAQGANCASIAGATAKTYTLQGADVGHTVRVVVTARNGAGAATATSAPTGLVQEALPGGTTPLPNGKLSVPIESVALPARLVIDQVHFSPNPVRSRSRTITVRVHVSDTRGFYIRGALVFLRSTPLLTTVPPETPTAADGWVTLRTKPRAPRAGLVFPLRSGLNVQFYVQARKAGESVVAGVTATRLVQVRTAG